MEIHDKPPTPRRWWLWLAQAALALAVGWFVWRSLAAHWSEFRELDLSLRPRAAPIVGAGLVVWATYGFLIGAWLSVLRGWGERVRYGDGARIWCVSNLGRYLPGRVWGVAGLAVLARRAGVSGWAAAASALALQALAVGTGGVVIALFAPGSAPWWMLLIAAWLGVMAVAALVSTLGARLIARVAPAIPMRPLTPGTAASAVLITGLSWVGYGVALWLLAKGIIPVPLGLPTAIAAFAAAYVVGLLAVFAPGGIGVREALLVALLTPAVGTGPAVTLTVASRLLLTVTEVSAALIALAASTEKMGEPGGGIRA